jgi:hypothetical protein
MEQVVLLPMAAVVEICQLKEASSSNVHLDLKGKAYTMTIRMFRYS